jgi:hypothetical protein
MLFIKKFIALRKLRKAKEDAAIWNQLKPALKTENKIQLEKEELTIEKNKNKFPTWGKILLIFLFLNFTILEIFTAWVTKETMSLAFATGMMPDFTPLITLLGSVAGQTLSYGIYSAKSKAENTQGGIIYDLAMLEHGRVDDNNGDAVG